MADLFDFEIKLTNTETGKDYSINVSKKTKELYDALSEDIQNKDESILKNINTFLIHFNEDIFKNAYYNGSMNGPLFCSSIKNIL